MKRKPNPNATIPPPPGMAEVRYRPASARQIENLARVVNAKRVHSPKRRAS